MPETTLEGVLTPEFNASSIMARINEDCTVTIVRTDRYRDDSPVPGEPRREADGPGPLREQIQASNEFIRYGWAKAELLDFADIYLTRAYADMYYDDNGYLVLNGRNQSHRCQTSYTLWNVINCSGTWSPSGPYEVWVQTDGSYIHDVILPSLHWLMAKYQARPEWGRHTCRMNGYVIGPVHFNCTGMVYFT